MTEVNLSTTEGKCPQQWGGGGGGMSATVGGNVRNSGGNVCNSGEIEYVLGNLRVEIVIHNSA